MIGGLTVDDLQVISHVFSEQPAVKNAILFGSRAKGNFRQGSDIDIALTGESITFQDVSRLSYILNEETNLPYKIDLLNYHTITEPDLKAHIDRIGIEIYKR